MNAQEKKLIYDLLKTAATNISGYVPDSFKNDAVFFDDLTADANVSDKCPENSRDDGSLNAVLDTKSNGNSKNPTESPFGNELTHNVEKHAVTISEISQKISRCTRCQLARTRNNVVPGTGVEHPDVLVVGEGPGHEEDVQGLPFVGKAGQLLDKMLNAIELDRKKNCYIANVVKCRPPNNRDPLPDEENACFSFLEAQIHVLKPKMILCMGRIAGHKMLDMQVPMKDMRGQIFDYNGIPLMVTYHPSALLRDAALKRPAWEDLKKFRMELNRIRESEPAEKNFSSNKSVGAEK